MTSGSELNAGLIIGLAGTISGVLMAALAFAIARAPGWRELRSFALVAVVAAAYSFFGLVHVVRVSERAHVIGEMLTLAASFAYGLAWIHYLAVADGRALRTWERVVIAIGLVMVVLALVPELCIVLPIRPVRVEWFGVTYRMATGTGLAYLCVGFIVVATLVAAFRGDRRWRDGWHARLPMLGACALALTGVTDSLGSLDIVAIPQLIEAVTVAVVGALGASYARRFVADARRLDELSTRLEQEVVARTSELMKAQATVAEHERLAGLGRMATGVAHEINNPTAVIEQNLDRMEALVAELDALSPELASRFERTRAATLRISEIVRQLLDTWRPSRRTGSTVPFAVGPVVERAISAALASVPALRVERVIADDLCARGSASSLEQVLINLLVNAQHAANTTPDGARIRVDAAVDGERVRLSVTDNGPGIPSSIRDRLFEPFATTKPVGQGTGLGLAVSRNLMVRQGGALALGRTGPEGTEMIVELPAASIADVPAPPPVVAPVAQVADNRRELRVLVIEDNDDLREIMVLQLDRFFQVDDAASVEEALQLVARQVRYDAVLCDLMMPSGGAESWLSGCASIDPRLDDRTILITGGPTTPAATALVEAREGRVMFKPPNIGDLRSMIELVAGARP